MRTKRHCFTVGAEYLQDDDEDGLSFEGAGEEEEDDLYDDSEFWRIAAEYDEDIFAAMEEDPYAFEYRASPVSTVQLC